MGSWPSLVTRRSVTPASASISMRWGQSAWGMFRVTFKPKILWFSPFLISCPTGGRRDMFSWLTSNLSHCAKMAQSITNDHWGWKNQTWVPGTSAAVHFWSLGANRCDGVTGHLILIPSTENSYKQLFLRCWQHRRVSERGLGIHSFKAYFPSHLPPSLQEQKGLGGWTEGPCRPLRFHAFKNTLKNKIRCCVSIYSDQTLLFASKHRTSVIDMEKFSKTLWISFHLRPFIWPMRLESVDINVCPQGLTSLLTLSWWSVTILVLIKRKGNAYLSLKHLQPASPVPFLGHSAGAQHVTTLASAPSGSPQMTGKCLVSRW